MAPFGKTSGVQVVRQWVPPYGSIADKLCRNSAETIRQERGLRRRIRAVMMMLLDWFNRESAGAAGAVAIARVEGF